MMITAVGLSQSARSSDSVRYRSANIELAATFLRPESREPVPAVVLLHGSGPSARNNPWTAAYAQSLMERGIAVLHPDKRGSGSSGGAWTSASFHDLAADASAGIRFLRSQPGIDTSRIGVIGFSQGGYVAAVVSAVEPMSKFSIIVSGGVASLMEQMVNELELEAERAGIRVTEQHASVLRSVYRRSFHFAETGKGWKELLDTLNVIQRNDPVLAQAFRTLPRDSSHWAVRWVRIVGNFDPLPFWEKNRRPALFLYGGKDTQVKTDVSLQRLVSLPSEARVHLSVHYFGGNGHALHREDCLDFMARWISDKGAH